MRKNKKPESQESCNCITPDECPYTSEEQCYYDKKSCALIKEDKDRRKHSRKPNIMALMVIISSLLIIGLEFVKLSTWATKHEQICDFINVLIGGLFSVIAASIIAWLVDIPSYLKKYEMHFANILSSNSYLKNLDGERLSRLRRDVTTHIHKTEAPHLPEGLVRMDEEICDLFYKPYYERYSHLVQCRISPEDPNVIEKEHVVEYLLVNPGAPKTEAKETIKISNLILQRDANDKGISDFELAYQIDGEDEKALPDEYKMLVEPLDKKIEFYTAKVFLGKDNPRQEGATIRFKKTLRVKYSYKINVDIKDRCFTKRLQHPAKLFIVNYSCANDSIRLHGQIIGTNLKQKNMSIQYLDDNSINMISYDWLLPDNGAIIVMLDKK